MTPMRKVLAAVMAIAVASCATSSAFRAGEKAERLRDYDRAVLEYSRALTRDPENVNYQKALERARRRATEAHAQAGRMAASRGLYKEALEEFRLALDLTPGAESLVEEMRQVEALRQAGLPATSVAEMKDRAREYSSTARS